MCRTCSSAPTPSTPCPSASSASSPGTASSAGSFLSARCSPIRMPPSSPSCLRRNSRRTPREEGTNSETCIVINFKKRVVLICGTSYAGEMKKSAFTIMNYLLPARGVFPMHCSANVGPAGDVALFFGLSGTGKTTLSADPQRRLIGDDEHGWSDRGVFNFEGGCYAKCIRLSRENEPQIWNAIRFGTVLENVVMDSHTRRLHFDSDEITENTRAAYPLDFIDNAVMPSVGGHPAQRHLPDRGRVRRPAADLAPHARAGHVSLPERLHGEGRRHRARSRQGARGDLQRLFRIPVPPASRRRLRVAARRKTAPPSSRVLAREHRLGRRPVRRRQPHEAPYTRAMLNAALSGELTAVPTETHPVFKVAVPSLCPGVPPQFLDARGMWPDKDSYDRAARDLAARFNKNFAKFTGVSAKKSPPPRPAFNPRDGIAGESIPRVISPARPKLRPS